MGVQTRQRRLFGADLALEVVQSDAPRSRHQQPACAGPEDEAALGTFIELFLAGLLRGLFGHGQPGDDAFRHPGLVVDDSHENEDAQHHVALQGHQQQHGGHDQVGLARVGAEDAQQQDDDAGNGPHANGGPPLLVEGHGGKHRHEHREEDGRQVGGLVIGAEGTGSALGLAVDAEAVVDAFADGFYAGHGRHEQHDVEEVANAGLVTCAMEEDKVQAHEEDGVLHGREVFHHQRPVGELAGQEAPDEHAEVRDEDALERRGLGRGQLLVALVDVVDEGQEQQVDAVEPLHAEVSRQVQLVGHPHDHGCQQDVEVLGLLLQCVASMMVRLRIARLKSPTGVSGMPTRAMAKRAAGAWLMPRRVSTAW